MASTRRFCNATRRPDFARERSQERHEILLFGGGEFQGTKLRVLRRVWRADAIVEINHFGERREGAVVRRGVRDLTQGGCLESTTMRGQSADGGAPLVGQWPVRQATPVL